MFPDFEPLGRKIWFLIHQPVMILVLVINICALMIILAYTEWVWPDSEELVPYVHSIFGMITIGFAFFQVNFFLLFFFFLNQIIKKLNQIKVILAFFRVDPDHPKRFIFRYGHRGLGISTFVLAG